ncbi:MAG TPA: hypothetical protein ENJ82_16655 [Bacteroidetes bacterium]|nr:hypothetical protein [Bacteroidota bacterium]
MAQNRTPYLIAILPLMLILGHCSEVTHSSQPQIGQLKIIFMVQNREIRHSNDFSATVQIKNGDQALVWNSYLATIPALALEIEDLTGQKVLHLPPPVPNGTEIEGGKKTLAPGESETFRIQGLAINGQALKPGSIKVRFALNGRVLYGNTPEKVDSTFYSDWVNLQLIH